VNARKTFITALLAMVCPLGFGQTTGKVVSRYDAALVKPPSTDTKLTKQMTNQRKQLESMIDGYLVAFNASHGNVYRVHVGVPLATFADKLVQVAYDVADNSVMMQWNLSTLTRSGTEWKVNAFVNQSQTAAIAVSANF